MELEPHGIGGKAHAGEPRPFECVLALLDVLFGRAPVVVEGQHPFIGQTAIGDDEADAGEQFARMELDLGHNPARLRPAPRLILEAGVVAVMVDAGPSRMRLPLFFGWVLTQCLHGQNIP